MNLPIKSIEIDVARLHGNVKLKNVLKAARNAGMDVEIIIEPKVKAKTK